MANFALFTAELLVEFINENFDQFASEKAEDFPASVLAGIGAGQFIFAAREEGFSLASKGRWYEGGWGQEPANLMFLYVSPEHKHRGIGTSLVQEVKDKVTSGVGIQLQCEGEDRRKFFDKQGFVVRRTTADPLTYYMRFEPNLDA